MAVDATLFSQGKNVIYVRASGTRTLLLFVIIPAWKSNIWPAAVCIDTPRWPSWPRWKSARGRYPAGVSNLAVVRHRNSALERGCSKRETSDDETIAERASGEGRRREWPSSNAGNNESAFVTCSLQVRGAYVLPLARRFPNFIRRGRCSETTFLGKMEFQSLVLDFLTSYRNYRSLRSREFFYWNFPFPYVCRFSLVEEN